MSFMDGCRPEGPLEVLSPEEQRVTDYYQHKSRVPAAGRKHKRFVSVARRVAAVIEDLHAGRVSAEDFTKIYNAAGEAGYDLDRYV